MTKTVLFVTYGGGHASMVAPVIRALEKYNDIKIHTLALTIAGPYFKRQGLPFMGFKDFILPKDKEAIALGKKLAELYHQKESGIEVEETRAYHGLSYWDLIMRYGEAEADKLWKEKGRGAFFPLSICERIINRLRPDIVVTTNTPRAELASVMVANKHGIPTLSMCDLFGITFGPRMEADYVAVISPNVIENLRKSIGLRPGQKFLVTGNPAFDHAFDYSGPVDLEWRRKNFPSMPEKAKALLWIDDATYVDKQNNAVHVRNDEEVTKELDNLAHATKRNDAYLFIRPHPTQQKSIFNAWLKKPKHSHIFIAGDVPLYPLLNASDAVATYTSTVGCEALLMKRPVIQLGYYTGKINLPLAEWGLALVAATPENLPEMVRKSISDTQDAQVQKIVSEIFPQERAAPKIAEAIRKIAFAETRNLPIIQPHERKLG